MNSAFPYFGGKGQIARDVWARLGNVDGYCEPFGGSLAVALANPFSSSLKIETLNDLDGFICNFWRSIASDPEAVAIAADWPVSHIDVAARHKWLKDKRAGLTQSLINDPEFYDPAIAGVWVWGQCLWIGSGWCAQKKGDGGMGVHAIGQRPHLGHGGMGVHAIGQRPHLSHGGFYATFHKLAKRLRYSRIVCADWKSLISGVGRAVVGWGVFLDPPYTAESGRTKGLYAEDNLSLGHEVAECAVTLFSEKGARVALCGILGEYDIPNTWEVFRWKTSGFSYGRRDREEVVWFSPNCTNASQQCLF